uniref:PAP-associated domain-containing protein n=1 Tax=Alexandrium monilatum TaxID=311494 RepID=A0A7S4PXT0_9DINO
MYSPLATQELQTRLLPALQRHQRFQVVDQIWTARVPILKVRFDDMLEVDLSCHNTEPFQNTKLLRAYADLSPRVRELGLLVKLWAKGESICGAPQGYLSSYALTLMVVYYMLVDPEVQMPCLSTGHFTQGKAKSADRVSWLCPLSTQVLLARFFRFYAAEFQWGVEVVSVRRGQRNAAADPVYEQLRASMSPRLHIEDPFLLCRNLHCVLGMEQECIFYTKLCQGAQAIQSGGLPAGLEWSIKTLGLALPGASRRDGFLAGSPLAATLGAGVPSRLHPRPWEDGSISGDMARSSRGARSSDAGLAPAAARSAPGEWGIQVDPSSLGSEPLRGAFAGCGPEAEDGPSPNMLPIPAWHGVGSRQG